MKAAVTKFFSSALSGVLAGVLVAFGGVAYIIEIPSGMWKSLIVMVIIIFSVGPALIGLIASLFIKSGKGSLFIGFFQIVLGIGLIVVTPSGVASFLQNYTGYTFFWIYMYLAVISGVIFLISGVFLVRFFKRAIE